MAAAREQFAACGYDRATIRAIAADAGIDPAMVMRYFGNKEGLFRAATEVDLRLPDLSVVPTDQLGSTLAAHFVDRWDGDDTMAILLRSSVNDAAIGERVRQIFVKQVVPAVSVTTDDPATARARAGLVATQILGLALCRYVLGFPPVVAMTRDDIVTWIGPTLQRYLSEPGAESS